MVSMLCIWNLQSILTIFQVFFTSLFLCCCKITSQIQNAPQIFFRGMQIIVCQIFFNLLYNISPGKQGFHFSGNVASGIINKRSDDRIIACIFPVTCRLCLWIILQIVQIIQHIPWAVNIIISKMITIIPFSDRRCILRRIRIQQKFLGFFLGKPKIFTEPKRKNTV